MPEKNTLSSRMLHPQHVFRKIALVLLGGVGALVLVVLLYASSQAIITIHVTDQKVAKDFPVTVKDVPIRNGFIARKIKKPYDFSQEFTASFVKTDEPSLAKGMVTLYNDSSTSQALVATTRVLSDGDVLFRLKNAVTVPANGSVDAEVVADQPGVDGEIAPSTFSIPGLAKSRQAEVYAKSTEPMTGGTKSMYTVTQNDIDAALETVLELSREQGQSTLEQDLADGEILLGNEIFTELDDKSVGAKVGDHVEKFLVSAKVNLVSFAIHEDELFDFIKQRLQEQITDSMQLISFDRDATTYLVDVFDTENQMITLKVHAEGIAKVEGNAQLFDPVTFMGMTPDEVKRQFEGMDNISSVEVKLWPIWVRTVPRLEKKIFIRIES